MKTKYFLKFTDISDSSNEALGSVERGASVIERHYVAKGIETEVTHFLVNFYFDDWKSDEILAAEQFEAEEYYQPMSDKFYTEFGGEEMLYNLIEIANGTKKEWFYKSFSECQPLFVEI